MEMKIGVLGIAMILSAILCALKWFGLIGCSWLICLLPLIIDFVFIAICLLLLLICFIGMIITTIFN